MVCPYCHHADTAVSNSRPHRQKSQIWRRRRCLRCKTTFTTYETVADKELPHIKTTSGLRLFSLPRLTISIYNCLPSSTTRADDAYEIANTVYLQLSRSSAGSLSLDDIKKLTYKALQRFNQAGSIRYGLNHHLITPGSIKLPTD